MESGVPGVGGRLDAGSSTLSEESEESHAGGGDAPLEGPAPPPEARITDDARIDRASRSGAIPAKDANRAFEPPANASPQQAGRSALRESPKRSVGTPFAAPSSAPTSPAPHGSGGNGTAGLTQRLLSKLPWPGGPSNDPINAVIRVHRANHPNCDPPLLRRAYGIADQMHRGQYRKSGEPYITHPVAVAEILAQLGMDTITLVAGLLDDPRGGNSLTVAGVGDGFRRGVGVVVGRRAQVDKVFFGGGAEA